MYSPVEVRGSSFAKGKLNCLEVEELTGDGVMIGVYVLQPRSFLSTRLLCPSPTALVQDWMAFRPKL